MMTAQKKNRPNWCDCLSSCCWFIKYTTKDGGSSRCREPSAVGYMETRSFQVNNDVQCKLCTSRRRKERGIPKPWRFGGRARNEVHLVKHLFGERGSIKLSCRWGDPVGTNHFQLCHKPSLWFGTPLMQKTILAKRVTTSAARRIRFFFCQSLLLLCQSLISSCNFTEPYS